jgi:hypothetical protein
MTTHAYILTLVRSDIAHATNRYEAYNSDSWWFELADMANKLIMTSVLPFLPPSGQLPAGLAFSVAYMILLVLRPPYRRKGDYRLALVAGCEIIMISLAGLVISKYGASLDKATDVLLSVLFIAIIFLLLIAFLVLSYLNIVKLLRTMDWVELKEFIMSGFKTKQEREESKKAKNEEETEMIGRDGNSPNDKRKAFSIFNEDPDFGDDDGKPHLSKDPSFLRPLKTSQSQSALKDRADDTLTPIGADQRDDDDDFKTVPMGMARKPTTSTRARGDIIQMSTNPLFEAEKDPFAFQRTLSARVLENPRLAALQALRDDDPPPPPPTSDEGFGGDVPPPPPPTTAATATVTTPNDPFGGDPFASALTGIPIATPLDDGADFGNGAAVNGRIAF